MYLKLRTTYSFWTNWTILKEKVVIRVIGVSGILQDYISEKGPKNINYAGPCKMIRRLCTVNYINWTIYIFLITKPTRCTNLSNLFLEIKLYIFHTIPLSIIRSFSLYTQQWYMPYRFCWQLANRIGLASCQQKLYDIYYCCVYIEKLLMMDRGTFWNI